MTEARITIERVAPSGALALLARDLLADFSRTAPDLSGAVVVLPNLHSATALARALGAEAGGHVLLPKTTTLGLWAAEAPPPVQILPLVVREAMLFEALRSRKWFDAPDLWPLVGELAGLFDELTRSEIVLPENVADFEQALAAAYQAKSGAAMQFEARLVHELWHASAQPQNGASGIRVDAAAVYPLQLARIVTEGARPLYGAGLSQLTPAERIFFQSYAKFAPVRLYEIDGAVRGASQSARFYANVWPALEEKAQELRDRASKFAHDCPTSPIEESVSLFGAVNLEQEARAVDAQIRLWLTEGRKKIAVVALDRLVARRARALLERAEVMVDDETGWIFSTTSASTVIMRWLDAASAGFYFKDLLDVIKSPFIFHGWTQRREAVHQLEGVIRSQSVVAGLDACRYALNAETQRETHLAVELLERLEKAARILRRDRRRRLHEWMSLLFGSIAALGVQEGLSNDPAGLQLIEFLQRLSRDLVSSEELFSFGEWRRWLNRQLELAEFRDTGVSSPVIFTQLSLTRLRDFDAVVITGCDTAHLPGADTGRLFFNQSVRAQLGLPTTEQRLAQIRDDLSGLLTRSSSVLVTWQKYRNGEPNLLSPLFERMDVFHQLAWNESLVDVSLERVMPLAEMLSPGVHDLPETSCAPSPSLQAERVPTRISASGYNSLIACPYQFYGRYVLGLREADEVREEMEKRDYGEYVHRALRQFHAQFPICIESPRDQLKTALEEISDQVFHAATESNYLSHAWLMRWRATIPAYLDWQIDREQSGWRFRSAENKRTMDVPLSDGTAVRLEGRLDRIDVSATDALAVIDYKTKSVSSLRRSLQEPGEDVQLPVYAALLGAQVREAFYLALEGGETQIAALTEEVLGEVGEAIERLSDMFTGMRMGQPLPAQGTDNVCAHCEIRGLCRKQYWT